MTPSEKWNQENPEAVRAARRRYQVKEKERRLKLSHYMRAREDVAKALDRLPRRQRRAVVAWVKKNYP